MYCNKCNKPKDIDTCLRCERCRLVQREINKRYNTSVRLEAIAAYGDKCSYCGHTDHRVLEFDHINNDGNIDRKMRGIRGGSAFYRMLINNNFPRNIQLLCSNCHTLKSKGYIL